MDGVDGFLGTRASFMVDFVVVAMAAILPVLAASIYLVRVRKRYTLHKRIQLTLVGLLAVTLVFFEADMRTSGWRHRAAASAYAGQDGTDWISVSLAVHLFFAITTALLWIAVPVRALRNFPNPPMPGTHSPWHRRFGWLATIDMLCTTVTGWIFYWLAFVG